MKTKKRTADILYILTNPCLNGWVKIGITDNLEQRLKSQNGDSA
ncbi:MAG: GIY-YIG nuclease family protein [Candidatus Margulisbacteria bacterium]|jgi:predicted GIY-YIG superfamily endonuclease|nr:GIY-YIG nuclease family protein [Candidatus Margulisiibacteriota bacterium]